MGRIGLEGRLGVDGCGSDGAGAESAENVCIPCDDAGLSTGCSAFSCKGVVSVNEGMSCVSKFDVVGDRDPTSRLKTKGLLDLLRSRARGVSVVELGWIGRRTFSRDAPASSRGLSTFESNLGFFFFGEREDGRGVEGP